GLHDRLAVEQRAVAEEREHHQVVIADHDHTAAAVGLAVDHPPGVGNRVQAHHLPARPDGAGDGAGEPSGVHRHVRIGFQDPQRDARVAVVEAAADPGPIDADHVDDRTGPGALRGLLDQSLEDPGVGGFPGVFQAYDGVGVV